MASPILRRPLVRVGGKTRQLRSNELLPGTIYETRYAEVKTDFTHNNTVQEGFLGLAIGTGSTSIPLSSSALYDGGKFGLVTLRSGTAANSGYKFATVDNAFQLTGNGEYFRCHFNLTSASMLGFVRLGFFDGAAVTAPTDAACLEIDIQTTTATFKTYSNGSTVSAILTTAISRTTWYTAEIIVVSTALAVCTIYDESGVALWTQNLTTNIPVGNSRNLGAGTQATNSGTNAQDVVTLDYQYAVTFFSNRY